jgi:hypothetical protein
MTDVNPLSVILPSFAVMVDTCINIMAERCGRQVLVECLASGRSAEDSMTEYHKRREDFRVESLVRYEQTKQLPFGLEADRLPHWYVMNVQQVLLGNCV